MASVKHKQRKIGDTIIAVRTFGPSSQHSETVIGVIDQIDKDSQGIPFYGLAFVDKKNKKRHTYVSEKTVKNPTASQIVKCKKILSEGKGERPTISHYRDMKNPGEIKKLKSDLPYSQRKRQAAYNKAKKLRKGNRTRTEIVAVLRPVFSVEEIKEVLKHLATAAVAPKSKNPAKYIHYKGYQIEPKKSGLYYVTLKGDRALYYTSFYLKDAKVWIDSHPVKANFTKTDFVKFTSDRMRQLAEMFQGEWRNINKRIAFPDNAPKTLWGLGHLVLLKIKNGGKVYPIHVDSNDAYVAGDLRCNLWFVGKDARLTNVKLPRKGELYKIGELVQVDYVTQKAHIEAGKLIRFWHKLGEATGRYPTAYIDHDGFIVLLGGEYDIWDVGIVN